MTTTPDSLSHSIKEILNSQSLAVLATNAGSSPYTSLVGFMASQDLKEIYFATFINTRKYQNISKHSRVSLLIDSRTNRADDFKNSSALTISGSRNGNLGASGSSSLSISTGFSFTGLH